MLSPLTPSSCQLGSALLDTQIGTESELNLQHQTTTNNFGENYSYFLFQILRRRGTTRSWAEYPTVVLSGCIEEYMLQHVPPTRQAYHHRNQREYRPEWMERIRKPESPVTGVGTVVLVTVILLHPTDPDTPLLTHHHQDVNSNENGNND